MLLCARDHWTQSGGLINFHFDMLLWLKTNSNVRKYDSYFGLEVKCNAIYWKMASIRYSEVCTLLTSYDFHFNITIIMANVSCYQVLEVVALGNKGLSMTYFFISLFCFWFMILKCFCEHSMELIINDNSFFLQLLVSMKAATLKYQTSLHIILCFVMVWTQGNNNLGL